MPCISTCGRLDRTYKLFKKVEIVAGAFALSCNDCVRRSIQQMENTMKNLNHPRLHQVLSGIGVPVAVMILVAGCASAPPPPIEQMAVSRAAMTNANSAGANELAPVQFKSALDKMQSAEEAMTAKNYPLAKQLAEEAEVDAKLAGLTARSVKAQKAAEAIQEDSRILRKEIDRKTK